MRAAHSITESMTIKAGYRLICSLFAAYDFPIFYRNDDPDPLDNFLQFSDEEITQNLIILASTSRAFDDELGFLKKTESQFPQGVGKLIIEGDISKILTVRDACNKIIHAKVVAYDFAWSDENPIWGKWYNNRGIKDDRSYKTPALNLEGKSVNGKKWEARVELVPFIIATSLWDIGKWRLD